MRRAFQVATFLRCAALGFPIPRQARRPTTNHEDVGRFLFALGKVADAFERASSLLDPGDAEIARNDHLRNAAPVFHRPGAQAMSLHAHIFMRGRWP